MSTPTSFIIPCTIFSAGLIRAGRISCSPNLYAGSLSDSHNAHHVGRVHHHLEHNGVLKISLAFDDDKSKYLEQLVLHLHKNHGHGLPITHSSSRGWFWDVRPSPETTSSHQARSETMDEFPWHTDCSYDRVPPRYFALQVLQPDTNGGGTLSVLRSEHLLSRLSPTTRISLTHPEYAFTVPPEFTKDDNDKHIVGCLLSTTEEQRHVQLRFRADIISPLTTRAESAYRELQGVLSSKDIEADIIHLTSESMPRGSIILLDNRRWLHSRNIVKDPNRHLRRVRWDSRPFSEDMLQTPAHIGSSPIVRYGQNV
ncbi:Clavaminate synthase-like protein [Aspergillus alliaceus]|uniref:Clavaminate synthase-like protein n=1 Tax=Petromyces alliaceus TaxID=209559 RepID=UPI0012A520D7|nr:Clavaminate synthase-like protein [Aspergillus alliaceus]KAB8233208.1 Clavaminate synthase-like protein [Aspergillus alliaceus]